MGPVEDGMNRCRKLSSQLIAGKIEFKEFGYNLTLTVVSMPKERMEECIQTVPQNVIGSYRDYLREFLEPVDFMPCPIPFTVDWGSQEDIDRKKQELRPKYLHLYRVVK